MSTTQRNVAIEFLNVHKAVERNQSIAKLMSILSINVPLLKSSVKNAVYFGHLPSSSKFKQKKGQKVMPSRETAMDTILKNLINNLAHRTMFMIVLELCRKSSNKWSKKEDRIKRQQRGSRKRIQVLRRMGRNLTSLQPLLEEIMMIIQAYEYLR